MNKSKYFWIIPVIVVLFSLSYFAFTGFGKEDIVITGLIEAEEVDVAVKIPGRISEIYVEEGSPVSRGMVIARLESKEIDAKKGQAEAAVRATKAKLALAKKGARQEEIDAYEQVYIQAKSQFEFAEKSWKRIKNLYDDGIVSAQVKDETEFKYNAANAQMAAAFAKYTIAQNGARPEEIEAVTALVAQAENVYNEVLAAEEELSIKSPINGELVSKIVSPGEVIAAGYPVLTIKEENSEYAIIHVREDLLKHFEMGAEIRGNITALAMENILFKVNFISPMADFASWRPTNQKGEYDLKSFEIKLKPVDKIKNLRPGMTVNFNLLNPEL